MFIIAWQTLQFIIGIPPWGVGVYGSGNSFEERGRTSCEDDDDDDVVPDLPEILKKKKKIKVCKFPSSERTKQNLISYLYEPWGSSP